MRLLALITGLLTSACCSTMPKLPAKARRLALPEPAYRDVRELNLELHDAERGRDVPVKLYAPAGAKAKLPVVIVSHGIGEDRDSYAFLGRDLARHGYLAAHITHAGTDRAMLRRGYRHLYRAVKDPRNWIARVHDVTFVLDELAKRDDADVARSAVAGHSAGAFTAMAMAGLATKDGTTPRDPRVQAIVAMSMPRLDGVVANWNVPVPVLHMTGTCDTSLIYRTFPRHRRIPFEQSQSAGQALVTIDGVNHDTFSNVSDRHHPLIAGLTVAFLAERSWFEENGTAQLLGTLVAVEAK
jgi:dienelactone hydrolase